MNRFYRCTECDSLEDGFMKGILENENKLVCRVCYKPTKNNTKNQIINFKKNREMK